MGCGGSTANTATAPVQQQSTATDTPANPPKAPETKKEEPKVVEAPKAPEPQPKPVPKEPKKAEPAPPPPAASAPVSEKPVQDKPVSDEKPASQKPGSENPVSQQPVVEAQPARPKPEETKAEPAEVPAEPKKEHPPFVVFVLGGPGSGKGTQCARIVSEFGYVHLSAGDLLREECNSGSENGQMITTMMKEGKLVPPMVTINLLKKAMSDPSQKYLIDGFPRAIDQAELFEQEVGVCQRVIFFDCPQATMEARLMERGKTSGRPDDNAETIKKRFLTFQEQSMPVVQRYRQRGLCRTVSAIGSPEAVFATTRAFISHPHPIVLVMGPPAAGKTTQCERLTRLCGFVHLSVGELMRQEVKQNTQEGKEISSLMSSNAMVPGSLTLTVLKKHMIEHSGKRYLIDGFPRSLDQIDVFDSIESKVEVLYIACSENTCVSRVEERGRRGVRTDDTADVAHQRYKAFTEHTVPVIERFRQKGMVFQVDGEAEADELSATVASILGEAPPQVVFVLGGPGSGKGTQCANLVRDFGFTHLSTGDLLRAEVDSKSDLGNQIASLMKEGQLVSSAITVGLLRKAMCDPSQKYLLDGFPRALDQCELFESQIAPCSGVLYLECPEATMEERLLSRGLTSGRADDNSETIKKRFKTFQEHSFPVVEHYRARGLCWTVSSVPTPAEVYEKVKECFTTLHVVFVLGGPGSGKGTQCARILEKYGYTHLSSGDVMREEVASGSARGVLMDSLMKQGKLVPPQLTLSLLKQRILSKPGQKFLLDGFPRSVDQACLFAKTVAPCAGVLYLDCPEATMESRLLARGQTSGRADDNAETIKKRFKTFLEQSLPAVAYLKREGVKVFEISAVPSPDEVFSVVQKAMEEICPGASTTTATTAATLAAPPAPAAAAAATPVSSAGPRILITGPPASGKGSQSDRLKGELGVLHISSGECLRATMASKSELGMRISEELKEGNVSDENTVLAVLEKLKKEECQTKGWLLDGFPRSAEQVALLVSHGFAADKFVNITMPREVLIERQTGRRIDPVTKTLYHITSDPPKEEEVLARLVQRQEDEEAVVSKKVNDYFAQADSVVSALQALPGLQAQTFDATTEASALGDAIVAFVKSE